MSTEATNEEGTNIPEEQNLPTPSFTFTQEPSAGYVPAEETAPVTTQQEEQNLPAKTEEQEEWVDASLDDLPDFENDDYILVEADEEMAFRLLKDKKGLEVDKFEDLLTPKEQKKYAPEMEKFNEFIEKTGNKNFNDFLETQKDWRAEEKDAVLKSYMKASNPDLSEKELNYLFNKKYNVDGLDEEEDEDEIFDKGINAKTDLQKAYEFFDKRKEEFKSVGGSDEYIPIEYREAKKHFDNHQQLEKEAQEEWDFKRNDFVKKTESFFDSGFEGFKMQLGDEKTGFEEFVVKPENLSEVKQSQLDSTIFDSQFFDPKTGELIKPREYHESRYFAQNYKEMLNQAYARGRAKELEIQDKASKNIQPNNVRAVNPSIQQGITFTIEKP